MEAFFTNNPRQCNLGAASHAAVYKFTEAIAQSPIHTDPPPSLNGLPSPESWRTVLIAHSLRPWRKKIDLLVLLSISSCTPKGMIVGKLSGAVY